MREFFYNLPGTGDKLGPIGEDALRAAAKNGAYPPDTLVWSHGMPEWAPLYTVFPEALPALPPGACPPNHLVGAVALTIFYFLFFPPICILGIFAIVKASNVETLWWQGHREEAERASRAAHTLNKWCLFLLLLPIILGVLLFCSIVLSFA